MYWLAAFLALAVAVQTKNELPPWMNVEATPEERAHLLLSKMTLPEKLAMVRGYKGDYVGNVIPNTRLNIPALHLEGKICYRFFSP